MTDFFDWLTATDAGALADRLAAQFRLSQEEMRRTTDALVPAFMLGFQRTMADPEAWTRFLRGFAPLTPAGSSASGLPSREAGEAFLRSLFGPELSAAIARQASLLTGQAPDVIEKMMPSLGLLAFQSMLQTMAAFPLQRPGTYPTDPAGHAMAEAMRRSANAIEAFSRPSGTGGPAPQAAMANLFSDALRGLPWMPQAATPAGAGDPFAMFHAWTGAWAKAAGGRAAPPASKTAGAAQPPPPFAFAGLLANAQSLQADYIGEMLSLFERHGARPDATDR